MKGLSNAKAAARGGEEVRERRQQPMLRPEAHRAEFKTSQATAVATSESALDTHCCFRSALASYARDCEGNDWL